VTNNNTLLLILGMHRSGTSLCTGIISQLGIPLASGAYSSAGEDNQKGYFEDLGLARLQDDFLKRLDSHWANPNYLDLKSNQALEITTEIAEYLNLHFKGKEILAIKDPRICRLLPLWVAAAQKSNINLKTIFIYRNPHEVTDSLYRRDRFPKTLSNLLWHIYYRDALSCIIENNIDYHGLFFEEILSAPETIGLTLKKIGLNSKVEVDAKLIDKSLITQSNSCPPGELYQTLIKNRSDAEQSLSDIKESIELKSKEISDKDYLLLIEYMYSSLNLKDDSQRKILNLEWKVSELESERTNTIVQKLKNLLS